MRNKLMLSKLCAFVFILNLSVASFQAQNLPYETATVNGQTYYKYNVKQGEGLYAVSRTFSVSVAEILRHNPDANSGLKSGQQLLIPVSANNPSASQQTSAQTSAPIAQQPPVDQNTTFKHTVARGETVFGISQMYNTTVAEINRYNPGVSDGIFEGQILTIPQRRAISEVKEDNYRYHTILPKETLYSVSRTYSLKPEDVVLANPGLSVETFQIGKTIRIPFFESYETFTPYQEQTANIMHKVSRGETLYSIARKYNVEVAELERANPMLSGGLKTNMELVVPVKQTLIDGDTRSLVNNANRLLKQNRQSPNVDVMKVGLLLPFLDEANRGHLRLQEYYEGFLLAVEKMKNEGANIELYVFEIGKGNDTKKLQSLLGTLEMQSLNLVIGGTNDAQIKVISDFSKAHNVKYVVPFSQSNGEVLNNGLIFQVNPSQAALAMKASNVFIQTFRNANIVFVNGGRNDKADFVAQLQNDLRRNNIKFETITASNTLSTSLQSLLSTSKENVIVPTTGESAALRQIMNELSKVRETNTTFVTRLFGYPEWQTYENMEKEYHQFGTYIYTPFFVDENDLAAKSFREDFRKWYSRSLMDTYPSYGMWGYDTGLFFLTALKRYGVNFEQNIQQVRVNSVQFMFNFERANNWGGFMNGGMYLIHYDTNGMTFKMDKSR